MGFFNSIRFSRLKEGLSKTRDSIVGRIQEAFSERHRIDHEALEDLEEILLGADVGVRTTSEIIQKVKERVRLQGSEVGEVGALLRNEMSKVFANGNLGSGTETTTAADHKPHVIMIVGVNGAGKTTTIGKLAHLFKSSGKKVLIAAGDTFRAAANEQLEIWAKRAGVDIVRAGTALGVADPAAVAFDSLKAALARSADVMIIDTAGRLHTKTNLMEELKKIKRVLGKQVPDAPHEVLLVLDATIGQNAIQQAKMFAQAVGITGLILTKLDGTAKGGVVLAIAREMHIPVRFIGVGEKIDDLLPFDGKAFVDALFETG